MDVYVDTETLADADNGIDALISELEYYTSFMIQKITQVNDRFSSKNYDRIVEALQKINSSIMITEQRLDNVKSYLSNLIEHIEEYSKKTYKS